MTRFDPSVLAPDRDRGQILEWLESGLAAVNPERLTAAALHDVPGQGSPTIVIAIGKAAPAMARGAASSIEIAGGVCVSDHDETTSDALVFIVGDHPVPGPDSLRAADAVIETVSRAPSSIPIVALISGGGSSLCEKPRQGVPFEFLAQATRRLIAAGADIEDINLVRAHLSAIKGGGVARAAGRPIATYVISDVAGADPGVVASGPTVPGIPDPQRAMSIMHQASIEIPPTVEKAMSVEEASTDPPRVELLADGADAARGVADAVREPATIRPDWLGGQVATCLDSFLQGAGSGVTIGVGETVHEVTAGGRGGRNTHAALLAAERLAGTDAVFVAFATDGVDGVSGAAGAIVDGTTISRGGDPGRALDDFDSASYLSACSDLLLCPPTGTNVSDIWILWRREPSST